MVKLNLFRRVSICLLLVFSLVAAIPSFAQSPQKQKEKSEATCYDKSGRKTGSSENNGKGTTTYYDKNGRKTGTKKE